MMTIEKNGTDYELQGTMLMSKINYESYHFEQIL